MSSSCSDVIVRNTIAVPQEMGDKTYRVDVPAAGAGCSSTCEITVVRTGDHTAALLEGAGCSGEELQCRASIDLGMSSTQSVLEIPMDERENRSHTLIVTDREPGDFGGFDVTFVCRVACA